MDTNTLLIILVVLLVLGGGGLYGRGRWYWVNEFARTTPVGHSRLSARHSIGSRDRLSGSHDRLDLAREELRNILNLSEAGRRWDYE